MLSKETIQAYVDAGQMEVKVIADSISESGKRITTFQLKYPRFIHSEVMTHRVFSRNASSSRAIPVKKMIEQVRNNPAMPIHWGANQSGMQAKNELNECFRKEVGRVWLGTAEDCVYQATLMSNMGAHKQIVNRVLEPFQQIHVVLTATEFDNFIELRYHEDAQPEIYALASLIKDQLEAHEPKLLKAGEWHLPYILPTEYVAYDNATLLKISTARCCRVSYLTHDNQEPSAEADLALYERLVGSVPLHASPTEHQAKPMTLGQYKEYQGNFSGWVQHRKLLEQTK